jgi:hypothetical protein
LEIGVAAHLHPTACGQERKSVAPQAERSLVIVAAPKQPTDSKPKYGFREHAKNYKDVRRRTQANTVQDNGCDNERNRN